MAVRPLPRLDALLEGDEDDEPTCVGQFSPEEVSALMREAEANEGTRTQSGIRYAEPLAIPTPLVVIPRAPLLPAIEAAPDSEETVIASVLPPAPAVDSDADELARVLDFDWDAHAPEPAPESPPAFDLSRAMIRPIPPPREPIPWPETPRLDPPPRGYGRAAVVIAVAVSIAVAVLFVVLASLFA